MAPFAIAVFLGAFLLFLIQPLAGRFVLPWFGGSAGVWTVCLLFFQGALLIGYVYAHVLTRLSSLRRQLLVHLGLLGGALFWLPPRLTAPANAALMDRPTTTLLLLLVKDLGVLFVLLSATGPLLQRWFYRASPQRSPYFLYALSNVGSLLGLLIYPFALEPIASRSSQALLWSGGFVCFLGVLIWSGIHLVKGGNHESKNRPFEETSPDGSDITGRQRLAWLGLPALGTAWLAASTTALTVDISPVPFLWVTPLMVYLVSFVITFTGRRFYRPKLFPGLLILSAALCLDLRSFSTEMQFFPFWLSHLFCLAVGCTWCHGELYRARPHPRRLTEFYLTISLGGALGTATVAVIAPAVFQVNNDLPLLWSLGLLTLAGGIWRQPDVHRGRSLFGGLAVAIVLVPLIRPTPLGMPVWENLWDLWQHARILPLLAALSVVSIAISRIGKVSRSRWFARLAVVLTIGNTVTFYNYTAWKPTPGTVETLRGFHGLIAVTDYDREDERTQARYLSHGSTTHGIQLLHPVYRQYPTSYYTPASGVGRALIRPNQSPRRHIGMLGLGVGTLAAYGMKGDVMRFFEIDDNVIAAAHQHFSFLAETPATVEIVRGDGRLELEAELNQADARPYDLLVLDAFSGDAVPTHLLTVEAFASYAQRLDPDGVIAVNISNRLVDLRPVIEGNARAQGMYVAHVLHQPGTEDWWQFPSEWILLAPRRNTLDTPAITNYTAITAPEDLGAVRWTDEFSSILPLLR